MAKAISAATNITGLAHTSCFSSITPSSSFPEEFVTSRTGDNLPSKGLPGSISCLLDVPHE